MSLSPGFRSVLVSAALGAALTPLNSTMVAVALPALSTEFGAPAATVTVLVVTVYLVATLICQMPAGSLADRIGHARALNLGRWVFGAGAVTGVLAPWLGMVVVGRLLMAAGGALVIPTAMALVRTAVPPERQSRAFGTMGAVMGGAAAVGPALGTWIVAQFGWRALFVINLPLLVASWLLQPPTQRDSPQMTSPVRPFDWLGSVLIGGVLVTLMFSTRAASPAAYWFLAVGLVLFAGLLVQERRAAAPVLNLDLFTKRGFVAGAGVIATQNLAMYSLLIQVPFLFGGGTGSNSRLGLAIVAMTATMAITSPMSGWLADWLGIRVIVAVGGIVATAGVVTITRLPAAAPALDVGVRLLLVGVGLGLSTGPANAGALNAVTKSEAAIAAATLSMLRYVGSIGGSVILSFAFAGGSDGAARHQTALWIFAGALVVSAVLGLLLPSLPTIRASRVPDRRPQ